MGRPIPDLIQIPSLSDVTATDSCIGFEYDNYVYTIIENTYKFRISEANGKWLTSNVILPEPATRIVRSYSNEVAAKSYVETINKDYLSSNTDLSAWVQRELQTSNISVMLDYGSYMVTARKYEY